MEMLKKNMLSLIFAVVALGGLGIGAYAYSQGATIAEEMQPAISLGRELNTVAGNMANETWIQERVKQREEEIADEREKRSEAEKRQRYSSFDEKVAPDGTRQRVERKPLMEDVLPDCVKMEPRIEFRNAYNAAFPELEKRLRAGRLPDALAYAKNRESFAVERQIREDLRSNAWSITMQTGRDDAAEPQQLDRAQTVLGDPDAQFALKEARSMWIYLDRDAIGQYRFESERDPPKMWEIWQAQMSLWIQQDLVTAVARVNEEREAELRKAGKTDDIWVANMPIKRLAKLSVAGLLGGEGGGGGGSNNPDDGFQFPNFTGKDNDDKIFVVLLALEVVMEQESMPKLMAALSDVNFITPVRVTYRAVRPDWQQRDYIYGEKPVVNVAIDMEAYYLHSVFDQWIPEAAITELRAKIGTTGEKLEKMKQKQRGRMRTRP